LIIVDRPPNFEQILAVFPRASDPGVIFAYNGKIYSPSGGDIPPALISHEGVHLERQREIGAELWWEKYLQLATFRYYEELLAHVAEFKAQRAADRNVSAALLTRTALRLVAPLYNYQPPRTLQQALKDLRREINRV
jgi:hypothetical protein